MVSFTLPRSLYRRALLGLVIAALSAAQLLAATKTWIGNAAAVPQISTITVANTWATADTATVTINGKALVVTIGANVTTAQVATAIKEAFMASKRLDGTASTDATSNAGGAQFGEFMEMSATVSGSVVTLIGVTPGKPVTLAVSESTAGSGTLALATPQSASGPNHWDNAKNWDSGTVPASDDIVVFRDSAVSCLYGLPNATLEVTFNVYQSYEGQIGLPVVNTDNRSAPYYEYRQRYVRLDDAGGGSDIAHRFGLGKDGKGSPLINVKHSTVKCSPIVYNTGKPPAGSASKALNLCCTANTSTLNIMDGSVDYGSQDSGTSAFQTVTQNGGDSRGIAGMVATGNINHNGGTSTVGGTTAIIVVARGGTIRIENQTGQVAITTFNAATIEYLSVATISSFTSNGGTLDARGDAGDFTITSTTLTRPTKIIDPYRRITFTNAAAVHYDASPDLQLGATAADPLLLDFN